MATVTVRTSELVTLAPGRYQVKTIRPNEWVTVWISSPAGSNNRSYRFEDEYVLQLPPLPL